MERFDDLSALLDHIWTRVEEGPQDFSRPFATPTFVTNGPDARTISLREASAGARVLAFHSDARGAKIAALRKDPAAAFHVWDAGRGEQTVLHGQATVHAMGGPANRLWEKEAPPALALYLKPEGSGTRVEAPQSGLALPGEKEKGELTRDDVADGRKNFAVVETVIDRIDWLHAHPEGHYRARFRWSGDAFEGSWVLP